MKKAQVCSVLTLLLDDEKEQCQNVYLKNTSRVYFKSIFHELMREDSDEFEGLL